MDVKCVDNQIFTGYVDKSVIKHVNRCVKNECREITDIANKQGVSVNQDKLRSVCDLGNSIIEELNNYIRPLHDNTAIKLVDQRTYTIRDIAILNGREKIIFSSFSSPNKAMLTNTLCGIKSPFAYRSSNDDYAFLERMHKFTQELSKLDKREIDNNLFIQKFNKAKEKASNFWFFGNSRTQKLAEKIDNLSHEFGAEASINWGKEVIKARFDALKKAKIKKQNHQKQKEIYEHNQKVIEKFINT